MRCILFFFFSSRRRHTISYGDWSSDVCSSDLRRVDLAPAVRRPVPAAEEALMHPVDRSEMSAARARMMARRRRSLTILGVGSVAGLVLALSIGGAMWVPALLFGTGLG